MFQPRGSSSSSTEFRAVSVHSWTPALLPAPEDRAPEEKPGHDSKFLSQAAPRLAARHGPFLSRSSRSVFLALRFLGWISQGPHWPPLSLQTRSWENSLPRLWGHRLWVARLQPSSLSSAGQQSRRRGRGARV